MTSQRVYVLLLVTGLCSATSSFGSEGPSGSGLAVSSKAGGDAFCIGIESKSSRAGPGTILTEPAAGTGMSSVDVSESVVAPASGTFRSLMDRAADVLNLLDYVGTADPRAIRCGRVDAAPAFKAAIASQVVGANVWLIVPQGTYRLDADVTDNGRYVAVDLTSGAEVGRNFGAGGNGRLYVTRVQYRTHAGLVTVTQGTGSADSNYAIGNPEYVINNGGRASYGKFLSYENYNEVSKNVNGGDVASHVRAQWHKLSGSGFVTWEVGITPEPVDLGKTSETAPNFAVVGKEINLVHNGPVTGWTEYDSRSKGGGERGAPKWGSIGTQFVPDAWTPSGRLGGHVNIGYAVFPDVAPNKRTTPYVNGVFSPFHIGNDAVAPGGRGMYFGGETAGDPVLAPYAGIEVRHHWPMFINLESAELTKGWIVNAKPGQLYRWATPSGDVTIGANIQGRLVIAAPGGISSPPSPMPTYPFRDLPTAEVGTIIYCSDCREAGQRHGAGTGVLLFRNASGWRAIYGGAAQD